MKDNAHGGGGKGAMLLNAADQDVRAGHAPAHHGVRGLKKDDRDD